jgi:hypothetical protein
MDDLLQTTFVQAQPAWVSLPAPDTFPQPNLPGTASVLGLPHPWALTLPHGRPSAFAFASCVLSLASFFLRALSSFDFRQLTMCSFAVRFSTGRLQCLHMIVSFEFSLNPSKLPLQGGILGLEGLYLLYVA